MADDILNEIEKITGRKFKNPVGGSQTATDLSPDEDLAIRTIIGEAKHEGPRGWNAVAGVIRNRSEQSGETYRDVVLAKNQFEPWSSRRKELEGIDRNSRIYQEVARTVLPILRKEAPDPVNGADHFYAPKAQAQLGRKPPAWENGKGYDIGNHRFFRLGYRGNKRGKQPDAPVAQPSNNDILSEVAAITGRPYGSGPSVSNDDDLMNEIAAITGRPFSTNQTNASTAPTPETPNTLEAQRQASRHPASTRIATLFTDPRSLTRAQPDEVDIPIANGQVLRANQPKLAQWMQQTGFTPADMQKRGFDFTPLIGGKAQNFGVNGGVQSDSLVVTRDARTGSELVASAVADPSAIPTETALQQDQFPDRQTTTTVTSSDRIAAERNALNGALDPSRPLASEVQRQHAVNQIRADEIPAAAFGDVPRQPSQVPTQPSPTPTVMGGGTDRGVPADRAGQISDNDELRREIEAITGRPLGNPANDPTTQSLRITNDAGETFEEVDADPAKPIPAGSRRLINRTTGKYYIATESERRTDPATNSEVVSYAIRPEDAPESSGRLKLKSPNGREYEQVDADPAKPLNDGEIRLKDKRTGKYVIATASAPKVNADGSSTINYSIRPEDASAAQGNRRRQSRQVQQVQRRTNTSTDSRMIEEARSWSFDRTGKIDLGNGVELTMVPDGEVPSGYSRFRDADGETYLVDRNTGRVKDESLADIAKRYDVRLVENSRRASVPVQTAKEMLALQVAQQMAVDYGLSVEDLYEWHMAKGFRDLETGEDLPADRFYQSADADKADAQRMMAGKKTRMGAPGSTDNIDRSREPNDYYELTRRDLREALLYAQKQKDDRVERAMQMIRQGATVTPEMLRDLRITQDDITKRHDDYQMAVTQGRVAADQLNRLTAQYQEKGNDPYVSRVRARQQMGFMRHPVTGEDMAEPEIQAYNEERQSKIAELTVQQRSQNENRRIQTFDPMTPDQINQAADAYMATVIRAYGSASALKTRRAELEAQENARQARIAQMGWVEYLSPSNVRNNIAKGLVGTLVSETLRGSVVYTHGAMRFLESSLGVDFGKDFDPRKHPWYQAAQQVDQWMARTFATNKDIDQEMVVGQVPHAIGTSLAMIFPSLTNKPKTILGLMSTLQMGGGNFEEALEAGASLEDAFRYSLMSSAALGWTEILGMGKSFSRLVANLVKQKGPAATRQFIREWMKETPREVLEEMFLNEGPQTRGQNFFASVTFDPARNMDQGVARAMGTAALSAGLVSSVTTGANVLRNRYAINRQLAEDRANGGPPLRYFDNTGLFVYGKPVNTTPEIEPLLEQFKERKARIQENFEAIERMRERAKAMPVERRLSLFATVRRVQEEQADLFQQQQDIAKQIVEASGIPAPDIIEQDIAFREAQERAKAASDADPQTDAIIQAANDLLADGAVEPAPPIEEESRGVDLPQPQEPIRQDEANVVQNPTDQTQTAEQPVNTGESNVVSNTTNEEEIPQPTAQMGEEPLVSPEQDARVDSSKVERKPIKAAGIQIRNRNTPEQTTPHKFSSTQVDLPPSEAKPVLATGRKLIPDEDLYIDPSDPSYGREENPHITVKYGLHTENADEIRKVLAKVAPFKVKLGKTSIFAAGSNNRESKPYDVVKIDVDSAELRAINKLIAENTDVTDTFPTYKPHVTIAYVKKGKGQKYVGNDKFQGKTITFDKITFSSKSGETTVIPLSGSGDVALPKTKATPDVSTETPNIDTTAESVEGVSVSVTSEYAQSLTKLSDKDLSKESRLVGNELNRWADQKRIPNYQGKPYKDISSRFSAVNQEIDERKSGIRLTQQQYFDRWLEKESGIAKSERANFLADKDAVGRIREQTDASHRRIIEQAVAKGKPVPAEVLADYPELKADASEGASDKMEFSPTQLGTGIKAPKSKVSTSRQVKGTGSRNDTLSVTPSNPNVADKTGGETKRLEGSDANAMKTREDVATLLLRDEAVRMANTLPSAAADRVIKKVEARIRKGDLGLAESGAERTEWDDIVDAALASISENDLDTDAVLRQAAANSESRFYAGITNYLDQENRWRSEVSDFFRTQYWPQPKVVLLTTPVVLRKAGIPNHPITITGRVMAKIVRDHGLRSHEIKQLIEEIISPVMLFESNSEPGSKVVVTSLFDSEQKPIAVYIAPDGTIGHHKVNPIKSVYGRNNAEDFKRWHEKGLLLYVNKEKSRKWLQSARLQLPIEEAVSDNPKILTEDDFVNDVLFSKAGETARNIALGVGLGLGVSVGGLSLVATKSAPTMTEQIAQVTRPSPSRRSQKIAELYSTVGINPDTEYPARDFVDRLNEFNRTRIDIDPILQSTLIDLSNYLDNLNVRVVLTPKKIDLNGERATGFYDSTGFILVSTDGITPERITKTVLHEMIHAFAVQEINSPSDANAYAIGQLKSIYEFAKQGASDPEMYGWKSPDEFVAEAISNASFGEALAEIELPPELQYTPQHPTVFDSLVGWIGDMVASLGRESGKPERATDSVAYNVQALVSDVIQNTHAKTATNDGVLRQSAEQEGVLFKIRTQEDFDYLTKVLPTADAIEIARFAESAVNGGNLEINEEASELIRRALSEMGAGNDAFTGALIASNQLTRIATRLKKMLKEAESYGHNIADMTGVKGLIRNLKKMGADDQAIVYVYDEALPEETHHKLMMEAGGLNAKDVEKLKREPLWQSDRMDAEYPAVSDVVRALELAAKIETGQDYWKGQATNAEKIAFLRIVGDSIVAQNTVSGKLRLDPVKYERLLRYASYTSSDGRRDQEKSGTRRDGSSIDADSRTTRKGKGDRDRSRSTTKTGERVGDRAKERASTDPASVTTEKSEKDQDPERRLIESKKPAESAARQKDRKFAVSLATHLLEIGDVPYDAQTEPEWLEGAFREIEENGTDAAIESFRKMPANTSEGRKTALGIAIAKTLKDEGRLGDYRLFGEELTVSIGNAAQELRAAALLSRLNPDFAPIHGDKITRKHHNRPQTPNESDTTTRIAEELEVASDQRALAEAMASDAEQRVNYLETQLADLETVIAESERKDKQINDLTKALEVARASVKEFKRLAEQRRGTKARSRTSAEVKQRLESIQVNKQDYLKTIQSAFRQSSTTENTGILRMAVPIEIDPKIQEALIGISAEYLANELPNGLTLDAFNKWIDDLTNKGISENEKAFIHAQAFDQIRVKNEPPTDETKARVKNRHVHAKAADQVLKAEEFAQAAADRQARKDKRKAEADNRREALKSRQAFRFDKFARLVVDTGSRLDVAEDVVFVAAAIREYADMRQIKEIYESEYSGKEFDFDRSFKAAKDIIAIAKDDLRRFAIETRYAIKNISKNEVERFRRVEKINATEQRRKLQELERHFKDLSRPEWKRNLSGVLETYNLPRALMFSTDMGYLLAQGGTTLITSPSAWMKSIVGASAALEMPALNRVLQKRGYLEKDEGVFSLVRKRLPGLDAALNVAGIKGELFDHAVTRLWQTQARRESENLGVKYETIGGTNDWNEHVLSTLSEKIPIVKQSNRLHSLTTDLFRLEQSQRYIKWLDDMEARGKIDAFERNRAEEFLMRKWVNVLTGKGYLGSLESAAWGAAQLGSAPRYTVSAFQMLYYMNPVRIAALPKGARTIVAQDAAKIWTSALLGIAVLGYLGLINLDPEDKEFLLIDTAKLPLLGKHLPDVKISLVRWLKEPARLTIGLGLKYAYYIASGNQDGAERILKQWSHELYMNNFGGIGNYWRGRLHPTIGLVRTWATSENYMGEPIGWEDFEEYLPLPLTLKDAIGTAKYSNRESILKSGKSGNVDENWGRIFASVILNGVGLGVSSYPSSDSTTAAKQAQSMMKGDDRSEGEKRQSRTANQLERAIREGIDISEELAAAISSGSITESQAKSLQSILADEIGNFEQRFGVTLTPEQKEILLRNRRAFKILDYVWGQNFQVDRQKVERTLAFATREENTLNDRAAQAEAEAILLRALLRSKKTSKEKPEFRAYGENAQGVVQKVVTWARAIGTDPVDAFNKLFAGERIARLENGTIIVERMNKKASEAVTRSRNGQGKELRLDHTLPLQLGGTNAESNLQLIPTDVWASYTPVENYLGRALGRKIISKSEAQDLMLRFKSGAITREYIAERVGVPFPVEKPDTQSKPKRK